MLEWVKEIAQGSGYSSHQMKGALHALGYPMSRSRARTLMREAGVQVRYRKKFKVTTNSSHKQPLFDNLVKHQIDVAQTDLAYVADITYATHFYVMRCR